MKISLTRRYWFAASHRLHSPKLSEAENQRLYGKCNNPYGHGHNYGLEVTVTGPVDPETGMIANLAELDPFVEREVIEAFDHKYLNEEVAEFRAIVPTTENVCREIYGRLRSFLGRASSGFGSRRRARTASNMAEMGHRRTYRR